MFAAIISTLITGGIVGGLGRQILPGKQDLSIPKTIGVGIIAALIVGLILGSFAHWIIAIIVSAIVAAGLLWFGDKKGWLKI